MKSKKQVLIISTPDVQYAAGIIAYDLFKGLSKICNVELLVKFSSKKRERVLSYQSRFSIFIKVFTKKIYKRLGFKIDKKNVIETDQNYYFFDVNIKKSLININKVQRMVAKPDVIIAYFMQNFFNLTDLYRMQSRFNSPIILIMADRVYITGGCHYFWSCNGYKKDCSECPALLDKETKHYAKDNLSYLKYIISKMNITLVSMSKQDYQYAKESTVFKNKPIYKIIGGIDLSVFYPRENRNYLRSKYGVNKNQFVILYGAVNIREKRKGFLYFLEAINKLPFALNGKELVFITIGGGVDDRLKELKSKHIHLGYISDYKELAEIFNISDLLLSTTIQDSGPMMLNQSLASGNPVVAFNVGVAQDLITDGITGYKSRVYNSHDLVDGVIKIINQTEREAKTMRNNCFEKAKKCFSKEVAAENIMNIVNRLL